MPDALTAERYPWVNGREEHHGRWKGVTPTTALMWMVQDVIHREERRRMLQSMSWSPSQLAEAGLSWPEDQAAVDEPPPGDGEDPGGDEAEDPPGAARSRSRGPEAAPRAADTNHGETGRPAGADGPRSTDPTPRGSDMTDTNRPPALEAAAAPCDRGVDWRDRAVCARTDPEVFFHPDKERGAPRRKRDAQAKAVCAGCPVIQQCREDALDRREPYGVWGGLTEEEREAIWSTERRDVAA